MSLPKYRDLPLLDGGARSGWNLFGPDDELGLVNLLTADKVVEAAKLIVSGERFALAEPRETIVPPLFSRGETQHTVYDMRPDAVLDDYYDGYYPQSGSQWDALAHYAYEPDVFYNGATADEVKNHGRNGIHNWARRGIIGRGVLLDFARLAPEGYDAWEPYAISVDDLERVQREQGVTLREGDILIVRTGFLDDYAERPIEHREAQSQFRSLRSAGLERSGAMAEYLWDAHVSAVASDNPGVEVLPVDEHDTTIPPGSFHRILIGQFGMALGELWSLRDLASACAAAGRWEFFFASMPLNTTGGIGSPANAVAIL